jgi:hypothetical protein
VSYLVRLFVASLLLTFGALMPLALTVEFLLGR